MAEKESNWGVLFKEFAIDPEVFSNWQNARFILNGVGVRRGRLVAELPRCWAHYCITRAKAECGIGDVAKLRIVERLCQAEFTPVIRKQFPASSASWIDDAVAVHDERPFDAIVLNANANEHDSDNIVNCDELDEELACWQVSTGLVIPRRADAMNDVAAPLLKISKRIQFIDPYFHPQKAYLEPLRLFLRSCQQHPCAKRAEIHCDVSKGHETFLPDLKAEFGKKKNRSVVPPEGLDVVRWKTLEPEANSDTGADKIHARYILTECGGLRFDYGLATGKDGETTDVSILDNVIWDTRRKSFQPDSGEFEFVDGWRIQSDGSVCEITPVNGNFAVK